MRILLTGATGFVGRHTLAALSMRGAEVVAVARDAGRGPMPGVRWVRGDLTKAEDIARIVNEAEATHLLHLGWRAVHGDVQVSRENFEWFQHSLDLAQAFVKAGGERIIGCGSCFEYDWSVAVCREDATLLAPTTLYGIAKRACHVSFEALAKQADVSLAWARPFFIYGPDEHPNRLVAAVAGALLDGKPAETSHGRQIRDYAHVDDVADGLAALAVSDATGAYNIATGQSYALKEIIGEIATQIGRPDLVRLGARTPPQFEPPIILGDTAKARADFGWEAKIDLKTGIANTIAGMREARAEQAVS